MESFQIKEFRSRIGGAIKILRKEEKISAAFLAKVLDVTQPTISRIEAGISSIPAEKLCFLAATFNRPLSYFVGWQSKVVVNEADIIRAGLVFYGARHLKAKAGIDASEYYKNYADLLNAALSEAADPRIANAVGATLYHQVALNDLNITKIITTITHKKLASNLDLILEATIEACHYVKQHSNLKRSAAANKLRELREVLNKEQVIAWLNSDNPRISPQSIAIFINKGLRNE